MAILSKIGTAKKGRELNDTVKIGKTEPYDGS